MRARLTRSQFPFLTRLTEAGRSELGALAPTRAGAGKRLLQRGEPANGAYLVTAGSLRVYYVTAAGREATLYRVEPGGTCVLALASTLNDEPYPAWVDAGPRGVELVRVGSGVFHRLLDSETAFRQFVLAALAGRVFELMSTLEELGSAQLEQRLARFLLRRQGPDGCVRVSQAEISPPSSGLRARWCSGRFARWPPGS